MKYLEDIKNVNLDKFNEKLYKEADLEWKEPKVKIRNIGLRSSMLYQKDKDKEQNKVVDDLNQDKDDTQSWMKQYAIIQEDNTERRQYVIKNEPELEH